MAGDDAPQSWPFLFYISHEIRETFQESGFCEDFLYFLVDYPAFLAEFAQKGPSILSHNFKASKTFISFALGVFLFS